MDMANNQRVFDATARDYDQGRRRLLPGIDAFYGAALGILNFAADAPLRVLDIGAGTGLLSAMVAAAYPQARITLSDISREMLAVARERLGEGRRFEFVEADMVEQALPGNLDAVVSALAIHHLDDGEKRALYGRIHSAVRPGGVFFNAEQVRGPTADIDAANHAAWLAAVHNLGVGEVELTQALERMKADRPATLDDQLGWLRDAGFNNVQCTYEDGMFAVFGGVA
jgi:tRNA (cmo5U34)-methyltransferase